MSEGDLNEASSTGIESSLIELLAKGGSFKTHKQPVAKTTCCCPQTDSKAPLLQTAPAQLTDDGDVELIDAHITAFTNICT